MQRPSVHPWLDVSRDGCNGPAVLRLVTRDNEEGKSRPSKIWYDINSYGYQ